MNLDNQSEPQYSGDPYEEVGRQLAHPDGTIETAIMKKAFWDYFDWLVKQGAISDISLVISTLDYERGSKPLGEALSTYLYEGAAYRKEIGLPNPSWLAI
jgi:ABC-type antimicrobial peptide transport system ATPase subunit